MVPSFIAARAEAAEGWAKFWEAKGDLDQAERFRYEASSLRALTTDKGAAS